MFADRRRDGIWSPTDLSISLGSHLLCDSHDVVHNTRVQFSCTPLSVHPSLTIFMVRVAVG